MAIESYPTLRVHSKLYTLIRNLSTYTFLHTELYHVAFPLEKVRTFTAMFTAFVY